MIVLNKEYNDKENHNKNKTFTLNKLSKNKKYK